MPSGGNFWHWSRNYPIYFSYQWAIQNSDIQNELVVGAQGAKEVHLILVDNGRTKMIESGFKEALLCIGCGACLNFCPVYHQMGNRYGGDYIGSRGIVMKAFQKNDPIESLKAAKEGGSFNCTLCGVCHENCPLRIDLPALVRKVREKQQSRKYSNFY